MTPWRMQTCVPIQSTSCATRASLCNEDPPDIRICSAKLSGMQGSICLHQVSECILTRRAFLHMCQQQSSKLKHKFWWSQRSLGNMIYAGC